MTGSQMNSTGHYRLLPCERKAESGQVESFRQRLALTSTYSSPLAALSGSFGKISWQGEPETVHPTENSPGGGCARPPQAARARHGRSSPAESGALPEASSSPPESSQPESSQPGPARAAHRAAAAPALAAELQLVNSPTCSDRSDSWRTRSVRFVHRELRRSGSASSCSVPASQAAGHPNGSVASASGTSQLSNDSVTLASVASQLTDIKALVQSEMVARQASEAKVTAARQASEAKVTRALAGLAMQMNTLAARESCSA